MSSEEKQYTLAEVAKHNSNLSTWIVIHNNVYDVTQYLIEHPGGEEVLLEQAGKDGSEPFEDATHSTDSRELMVKYKIGEIVEAERKPVKAICSEEYQESQRIIKRRTCSFKNLYFLFYEMLQPATSFLDAALQMPLLQLMYTDYII